MESISLRDQNNNLYLISAAELAYKPIKKEQSSSGIYSGGEPQTKVLTEEEWVEIQGLVQAILDNVSIQTDQRRMLTSALNITFGSDQKERYIITRSDELRNLLTYLNALLGK